MNNLNTIIGARLSQLRSEKGLTQEDLASRLLLSRTSIVNIESGRQQLTMDNLYRISMSLDCPISTILPDNKMLAVQFLGEDVVALIGSDSDRLQKMLIGFL